MRRGADRAWNSTALYVVGAIVAAVVLPRIERRLLPDLVAPINAAAAMAIYSAIASGMIALTGFVFSLMFLMVQFSASAYSPRLVQWFARDRLVAHAFGVFTATYLYAIAALAWIDRAGSPGGVPFVSALMVMALLVTSVVMFVGLIRRTSRLQITRTLAFTGDEGRRAIAALYPELSSPVPDDLPPLPLVPPIVQAAYYGPPLAVQFVDLAALVALAEEADAVIEVLIAPGDTLADSSPLARVIGATRLLEVCRLHAAIVLGVDRTFEQDPKYAIRLLVDIAIRALSPAINDPTTAVQALDQIGDLLLRLGRRRLELGAFRDRAGALRVTMPFPTWDDCLRLAFDEISTYGASSVQVMRRMHALVADLTVALPRERRDGLHRWRERLRQRVADHFDDAEERAVALIEDRQGLGTSRPRRDAADQAPRTPVRLDASPSNR